MLLPKNISLKALGQLDSKCKGESRYEKLQENNPPQRNTVLFPRDKIIRMAGNSIPVKMLEGFFYQLYALERALYQEKE